MSYAIVTGASKGIGFHIAERLAARGFDLLLIARSESDLKLAADAINAKHAVTVEWLATDLCQRESPKRILDFVNARNLPVRILVNNAGYGVWGDFESASLEQLVDMMEINTISMVQLTHLLLPVLQQGKPAHILNIASTAAYQAVPSLTCYAGSKSFVVLFSRGLDYELRKKGVSVTCFSPGPTRTNFNQRAGISSPSVLRRAERFGMDTEYVSDLAVKAMFNRKKEVVPGLFNRISSLSTYFVPKWLTERVAAGLYRS